MLTGVIDGDRAWARYTFLPTEGNCIQPDTRGEILLDAVLRG